MADSRADTFDAPNDKPVGADGRISDLEGSTEEATLEQKFGYVPFDLAR